MKTNEGTEQGPLDRVQDRQAQLEEAEETLRAIRCGEVDALVVSCPHGDRIYSLETAEHSYRVMVEAMSEGAVTLTGDGTIVYSNQSFAAMLQMSLEQVIGSTMLGLVQAADLPKFERLLHEGQSGGSKGEVRLLTKAGLLVPVHFSVSALESGAMPAVCAVVRDLTTDKRNQESMLSERMECAKRTEAEAGRQRITKVLESTTDSFLAVDREWRITDVNSQAAAIYQKTREALIGQVFWDVLPENRMTEFEGQYRKAMGEQTPVHFEARYSVADDRWFELHVYPTEEGISVYSRDITAGKKTEAKLRRSEARFRNYFELGLVGMAITSPTKGFLEVNDELCRVLGYPREELLHKTWVEMTHPDDLSADVAQFDRVLAGEIDGYTLDKHWIRKDGQVIDSIMAAKCQRRPDHSIDYFVGLIMDTTERKRAEEKLQKAHSELVRVAHATTLGELAASIAHEINQPLGAIVNNGNACLRLLRMRSWSELREAIAAMVADANRASGIIARTRAMINRSAPEKVRLQLPDVVADGLAMAQRDLTSSRIVVRTDLDHSLPSVSGDRVQLQEVLLNLMRNAMEAMGEMPDERRIMTIGCQQSDLHGKPAVLLTVQDRGCGFSPEEAGRIFDAFYTTKPNGMGMGLRICFSIVEAHGGRLTASLNSDGPGAMFHFLLPAVGTAQRQE